MPNDNVIRHDQSGMGQKLRRAFHPTGGGRSLAYETRAATRAAWNQAGRFGDDGEDLTTAACAIWKTERKQADRIKAGDKLRDQLRFADYLKKRATDPAYTFRQHLRGIGRRDRRIAPILRGRRG